MLQPVLEFNGLQRNDWDFVSWNCCPAGYVTHSDILTGMKEGDKLIGIIQQPDSDNKVFEITSTWVPATGQPQVCGVRHRPCGVFLRALRSQQSLRSIC